ncbi:saccharopine dehydrogenase NADP-binding domain-containing protein [Nonomuraea sp. NPDC050790]|uniref:saccharopine dehydrogenase NADP-binding domain-containing protein n=1 Tax=Nonomuraea sp. NPDC050790 TaxID=3364371 RepID=UPI00378CCEA1
MTIGVLGCYGAVGGALARRLPAPLRLGGRDPARVQATARPGDEAFVVDLDDADALARFCAGCEVVVNCAGPSARILDTVARAALAEGAHYVDVAGDLLDQALLTDLALRAPAGPRAAVLAAGMMPGLSALLPRAMAATADPTPRPALRPTPAPRRLVAHVGGLDRFTKAAALDYVASLTGEYATPQAAWQSHRQVRAALRPRDGVRLPHFPGRVSAYPYLSRETVRLARELGLAEVEWWGVFDGERAPRALAGASGKDPEQAAQELGLAAGLDAVGREPYMLLVFDLDGTTLTARATDSYELTAAVAASAVTALLEGRVPPGAHEAAWVLSPERVLDDLRADPAVTVAFAHEEAAHEGSAHEGSAHEGSAHEGSAHEEEAVEEGVL